MTFAPAETEAMRRAIRLAATHHPHPNPKVGAVVLDPAGRVISEGSHTGPGEPHAEQMALQGVSGPLPTGSTLIVTLEPCNHYGRTPPCTEAILAAGVTRVVVGARDPDPISADGIDHLRSHGIAVETGLLADEVEDADPAYFHHRRTGRALFILKTATTLDGQIAARDGTSQWITGEEAREDAHLLRARADAVMVGAGTLRADDPRLTVRLPHYSGRQPRAVVVSGRGPLPPIANVWDRDGTLVVATELVDLPVETVVVGKGQDGFPDLKQTAETLADRGLLEVLVEGGPHFASSLWRADLIDRGVAYLGGKLAGGVGMPMFASNWDTFSGSRAVRITSVRRLGPDVRIDWSPVRE